MSQQVTIKLSEFRAVAELVWKLNPRIWAWESKPKGPDDVLRTMIETARCVDLQEGSTVGTGMYVFQGRFENGKLYHIQAFFDTRGDEDEWVTLESLEGKI